MGNTYIFDDSHDYTGAVATFTDTHGTSRITNISVPLSPIQDLHGYSNPWPAGGGKNLYNSDNFIFNGSPTIATKNGITLTRDNGKLAISGTATAETRFNAGYAGTFKSGKTYTISVRGLSNGTIRVIMNGNPSGHGLYYISEFPTSDFFFTFTVDADVVFQYFFLDVQNGATVNNVVSIQIEEGSTATDWSPYSNICPISGRTGLSVWDDPKYGGTIEFNQKFPTQTLSYVGTNYTLTSNNDGKFTVNATATASQSTNVNHTSIGSNAFTAGHVYAWIGNSDKIKVELKAYLKETDTIFKATTAYYNNIVFLFENLTAGTYEVFPQLFDLTEMFGQEKAEEILALENGNTGAGVAWVKNLFPNEYYAYNSGTTTCVSAVNGDPYWKKDIDWTSEAGTVYGGTLDVVTGVLTVDRAMVDLGTLNWSTADGNVFYDNSIANKKRKSQGVICSNYANPYNFNTSLVRMADKTVQNRTDIDAIYIKDSAYSDPAAFKAAMSGVQLCYELATPLTYQLTGQEVSVIKNSLNNVWASTGSSITVTVKDIAYGFQGWLVKVGSSLTLVPTEMIEAESYKVTPDQRMEESAERDTTGYLWRDTVRNTPPKIEFNTPPVNNTQVAALNAIFQSAFTVKSQRKLQVAFFDPEEDCYKIWDCYMPDVEYPMHLIDPDAKTILYDSIRYAFIGY